MSIPSPRPPTDTSTSSSRHVRRPSMPISPSLSPRVMPVPVPQRHGSISSRKRPSIDAGSFGSSILSSSLPASAILDPAGAFSGDDEWLDTRVEDILLDDDCKCPLVDGTKGSEEAVEILLKSGSSCILVRRGETYGFFDYSDLNAFLLVVLQASGSSVLDAKSHRIASMLRRGEQVPIGELCDLGGKSPYHVFSPDAPLRTILSIFVTGVHRVAIPPLVLTDLAVLRHLASRQDIPDFALSISSPSLRLNLSLAVSLPGSATVLDAMQVMAIQGHSALGVTQTRDGSSSSGSSSSSTPDPFDVFLGPGDLVSVVTCRDCSTLVVPSEGKRVLGMRLEDMVKGLQVCETAGQARGEERFPVYTVTSQASLLHVSHMILATASSRVFVRSLDIPTSPPLSPLCPPSPTSSFPGEIVYEGLPGLPPPPSTRLSNSHVLSVSDILACLARRHRVKPYISSRSSERSTGSLRQRRFSTLEPSENLGFASWRWAK